ncbi:beta-galactosidase GalA [Sphingomonas floccifaciens]|uniref:Beta-galactosidase GalA n=1 Tax=Sphingomonas floccifaciens TaxID=1844115 RepID=A0ABW4NIT7_9SPHN
MRVARRDLLAGVGAAALVPAIGDAAVAAAPSPDWPQGPLAAIDGLPPRLPVTDPGRSSLDSGWLFHEGDIIVAPPATHNDTYLSTKAGNAAGAAAVDHDDSDWQAVTLPHDWASHQPFVESANPSQGYRPRGIGWYRRTLRLDAADRGKRIALQFDGIATNATIWVNGTVVAHSWSGYSSVLIDLTPFARFGAQDNVIAIRVDATAMEGWWYEGAGLYRHAWLSRRAGVSIAEDGVHCDPRKDDAGWSVPVAVTLTNIERATVGATCEALLLDPAGRMVARATVDIAVDPLIEVTASLTLPASNPQLWSVEQPRLYTVITRVLRDGVAVDERRTAIGFRTIRFDAARGFFLNDQPVKLKGVCIHQDHAGVGVAVPDALIHWRLVQLKALGCNAIRCSHHAPAAELLDYADRLGFLVMDENRVFNPSPDYLAQLEWMVRRDRNHPSVILWSVFNEEPMQGTEAGVEMVRRMAAAVHRLDASRPVTAAMNGSFYDPANVSTVVDVMGFNYYQRDYDRFHRLNPAKPITSSEDTSAFETRGAFRTDPAAHVITSYDTAAADWGATHRASWAAIVQRPFVAGGFVWTGFDYHGEPTPHAWPTISSFFGILDLCGFPKTAAGIRRAQWIDTHAVVAIAPHWTWPGREGEAVPVHVSSNAETIELRLNGRSLGRQAADRVMGNDWSVPYAPGRIEAVAYRDGRVVARTAHETAGPPVALRLTPARTVMAADGVDAQPVTVDAIDARGRHVPTANLPVRFTMTSATIIGLGNGDPNSHESEKGDARSLFNGLAQVILQSGTARGRITLTATAPGMKPATLRLDAIAAPARTVEPAVAAKQAIEGWRRSPATPNRPDPATAPAAGDNNLWAFVRAGTPTPAEPTDGWRIYRARITPRRRIAAAGGTIRFAAVAGRAELWVDGVKLADKPTASTGPIAARIPAGTGARTVLLLVEAAAGVESGLVGRVGVEA